MPTINVIVPESTFLSSFPALSMLPSEGVPQTVAESMGWVELMDTILDAYQAICHENEIGNGQKYSRLQLGSLSSTTLRRPITSTCAAHQHLEGVTSLACSQHAALQFLSLCRMIRVWVATQPL